MRRPDWPLRLAEFLVSRATAEFEWGREDCALTVCDAIAAMTHSPSHSGQADIDLAGEHGLRGYDSELGATKKLLAYLRARHWPEEIRHPLEATAVRIFAHHGFTVIAPLEARAGDVLVCNVLGRRGQDRALGVIGPDALVYCMGHLGLRSCSKTWQHGALTYSPIVRAWRIPEE